MCVQGRVYWGKACAKCAREGFRSFPELFVLPHSRPAAGTRAVGLVPPAPVCGECRDAVLVNQ